MIESVTYGKGKNNGLTVAVPVRHGRRAVHSHVDPVERVLAGVRDGDEVWPVRRALVDEEAERPVVLADDHVEVAVPVEVRQGRR